MPLPSTNMLSLVSLSKCLNIILYRNRSYKETHWFHNLPTIYYGIGESVGILLYFDY